MESTAAAPVTCRHEYVLIFQRKLKGLERRLTATKAWLPVGFKPTDFSHLGEGSYCFCSRCRARLFPKRTNAEKALAKAALAAEKAQALMAAHEVTDAVDSEIGDAAEDAANASADIRVDELELEAVELTDLDGGSVNLSDAQSSCTLTED
jgi:hypothetical protein